MKNKIKTVILILVVIIVAIIMTWFAYKIINFNNTSETTSNVTNNEVKVNSIENVKNTVIEEKQENTLENNQENNQENNTENETKIEEKTETNTLTNNVQRMTTGNTNEEKAINIVKKNWGSEEGVYFASMGIDANGRYIITVNDSSTTSIYAWYAVNIETGEFEVQ